MAYDNLFEPIDVGPITIPNRIVRSAHGTLLAGEKLIAYHEARAAGGVGMSTLEATGVHANAPSLIPLYSDACIPFFREISARMQPYGMKILQQIYHPGAATRPKKAATQIAPSAIPNPLIGGIPMEMTKPMIDEMVSAFADAARRCRDGGLDGIDLHASSGYLIEQFLSPANNTREDEYGGSLENRMRFLMEVLTAIRDAVGYEFCVGIRLPNEEYIPGGLTPPDVAEIAKLVEPYVDYVSLHMGSYWRFHKLLATMDDPLGHEMPANEQITRQVSKPTVVVGRIMTLDHASHIVASGAADMVSMVRALIADPQLVNKARRGDTALIRPCIGSNFGCVGQLMSVGKLSCVVNVAAGVEDSVSFEPPGPAAVRKKVLVVGGGPAGLEAARTAALRGHEVHLHEATRQLGGQVTIAATAPHRSDIGAITEWLTSEIERLGVTIRLRSMVDPDVVAELAPDEIIIATGGSPRRDGFQVSAPVSPISGHDLPHVFTSWDVFGFGGRADVKGPAVVFDDTGTFEAISVADALLEAGVKVTMIGRYDSIGATLPYPPVTVNAAKERLMSGDFDFIGGHYLQGITPYEVLIGVPFTERLRAIPASTVVLVTYNHPNRELAEWLLPDGFLDGSSKIHLVGDVTGTNGLLPAIHQAAAVAAGDLMHDFVWYDVFTDREFAGNPLAVFPDATGIEEPRMARIARELNLSETTFVLPADAPTTTHRVRIFTPTRELAFAGHPTVGTAIALAELNGVESADFVFGLGAGPTPVAVRSRGDGGLTAQFAAPQLPRLRPSSRSTHDVAALVGLDVDDFDHSLPLHLADAGGTVFLVAQVGSLEALARSRPAGTAPDVVGIYLVCPAAGEWRVRMFAPATGVPEDPATGSGACAFAGSLATYVDGFGTDGTHAVAIRQGVEMGRPSDLALTYDVAGGAVTEVRLAGSAVKILAGSL